MAFHCIGVVRRGEASIDTIQSLDLLGQERHIDVHIKRQKGKLKTLDYMSET